MSPDAAESLTPSGSPARGAGFTIEPLAPEHADELGVVHVRAWQEAYRDIMPPAYLATLDPATRADGWRLRASDNEDATVVTLVAKDGDGGIVGFISVGAAREENAPTDTQLWAINLLSRVHGTGLADELVRRALGDRPAYLWVVEGNARAQAFYHRHGFTADGAVSTHGPTGTVEIRMVRPAQVARGGTGRDQR